MATVKKLVVKTIKRSTDLSEEYIDSTWRMLSEFITCVHLLQRGSHSFEELYKGVEALAAGRHGPMLYSRLRIAVETNIVRMLTELGAHSTQYSAFLAATARLWDTHVSQIVLLRSVFLYLDTTYVRDNAGANAAASVDALGAEADTRILPLWDMGVAIFQHQLRRVRPELLKRVVDSFADAVDGDRRGEVVDRGVLSTVNRMVGTLRMYEGELRPLIVVRTRDFYAADGTARLSSMDAARYMVYVETCMRAERNRVIEFMDPLTTLRAVLSCVETQMVARHADTLLERGFGPLLQEGTARLDDLKRFFSLMSRTNKVDEMRKIFIDFARKQIMAIVSNPDNDEEKDKQLVTSLLSTKARIDAVIHGAFASNDGFVSALRSALEEGVNSRGNKPAELIAKFVDQKMRKGNRSATTGAADGDAAPDEDLDDQMDKVIILFRCIHSKDVFEAFYKKDLAKRILLGRSTSVDAEKSMVSRLKTECGSAFTSKIEGMFKDADGSAELMKQFEGSTHAEGLPCELDVHVLTAAYWPTYAPLKVLVPPVLQAGLDRFASFYQQKYSTGRMLHWQHSLAHCLVKAQFPSGRKELDVSFFQTLVLLQFNEADSLGFLDILRATAIEDSELRRTLQSLALGQVRVLRKEPKGKDVLDGDVFHFNSEFKAALVRIKINTIQLKETKQEVDATHEQVIADRQHQIDAAIVRIMKSRKSLVHQRLLAELFGMLRFPVQAADVKPRIESLIDREYMERDETDLTLYHYVA